MSVTGPPSDDGSMACSFPNGRARPRPSTGAAPAAERRSLVVTDQVHESNPDSRPAISSSVA